MSDDQIEVIASKFIDVCDSTTDPLELPHDILGKVFESDLSGLKDTTRHNIIRCVSYYSLHPDLATREAVIEFFDRNSNDFDQLQDFLIQSLKPKLLRSNTDTNLRRGGSNGIGNLQRGLNPALGFSFEEDKQISAWKKNGGIKNFSLFYLILRTMRNKQVSLNLHWIIPGIMNMLDNTTDMKMIKMNGVLLLRTFLSYSFQNDIDSQSNNWISFQQTGIFEMVEPILLNLCYFLPPSYNEHESLDIHEQVYETLIVLYEQSLEDAEMKRRIGRVLLSDIIIRHTIPRIGIKYESLLEYQLTMIENITSILKKSIIKYLQRILFTFGKFIIGDPFVTTTNKNIILHLVRILNVLVNVCDAERIQRHRYDFMLIICLIAEKYESEGEMTDTLRHSLKEIFDNLETKGCNVIEISRELKQKKGWLEAVLSNIG